MNDFDWQKQYKCYYCGKLRDIRYSGTIILRIINVRAIGNLNECIMIKDIVNPKSKDIYKRLSARFCNTSCMIDYFSEIKKNADEKIKNPPIDCIMNLDGLDHPKYDEYKK